MSSVAHTERVMIFIDANNLRQKLNEHFGKENAYIDVTKLLNFLGDGRNVAKSFYYVNKFGLNQSDIDNQNRFFAALESKNPSLTVKAFEMQKRRDTSGYQEKQIDNEITLDMALEISNYDLAILVSEDKDYVGTVTRIQGMGKHVEAVIPIFGKGHHLRSVCLRKRILTVAEIRTFIYPKSNKKR